MTDAQRVVMFAIWELTKADPVLAVDPVDIGKKIKRHAGYVRNVINQLMAAPHPRLQPVPYHKKPRGRLRKAYRIHDEAVNLEETAVILCQLRSFNPEKSNRGVDRRAFSQHITKKFGMKPGDVNARIDDALKHHFLESLLRGYIKGTQRLVDDFPYFEKLASAYGPSKSAAKAKRKGSR